jgi:hypothetical protein
MGRSPLLIGNAQAFGGDDPDAPARLVRQQPDLDFLTLDYLAEVSLFIFDRVLGEGGSRFLRIDAQGKTHGQAMLEMVLEA